MRPLLLAAAVAAFAFVGVQTPSTLLGQAQSSLCGTGRWDIKTLTDQTAGDVDRSQVIGVNVSTLAALPVPDPLPTRSRFDPYETTIYATTAVLVEARLQPNHDIVVVIEDPDNGARMIAAFPDAAKCAAGADPAFVRLMQRAREAFVQAFGMPGANGPNPLDGTARLTGIGFLDPERGQNGEAPNGFELHPVLEFLTSDGAVPAAGPTGTTTGAQPAATSPPSLTGAQPARIYYVDIVAGTILCDTDPAVQRAGKRNLMPFRSIELVSAVYPGYRLNRSC